MELKEYQSGAIQAFSSWLEALEKSRKQSDAVSELAQQTGMNLPPEMLNYPRNAWAEWVKTQDRETALPYVDRRDAAGRPIPHVCFKVPTGGGKTLLAAAALRALGQKSGLVLWMVPTNAIYAQTKAALWNREHPYRHMLEEASGGQVKVLEKDNPFTAADLEHYLCIMLMSTQAANRIKEPDFLKIFQNSGRYPTFFPHSDAPLGEGWLLEQHPDLDRDSEDSVNSPVKRSLVNIFKMHRPVIVLDEAHKSYGIKSRIKEEAVQSSVNRLNPRMVIELTATPNHNYSNLLVNITGTALHVEEMIKQPIRVEAVRNTEWQSTLGKAHAQLELLENEAKSLQYNSGRYIRPIAVVRVENTGKAQLNQDSVHSEDVRKHLIDTLNVPADWVAVQSAEVKELTGVNLHDPSCQVRWIITRDALREGWDCPFAYLLVMLDKTYAKTAITQLVGRIMRQPHASSTGREALDQCYVYCQNTEVEAAVQYVKEALESEGMGDLQDQIRCDQAVDLKAVTIRRREAFRELEIFLPKVLHRSGGDGWDELDYQRHLLPEIDYPGITAPDPQVGAPDGPQQAGAAVFVEGESLATRFFDPQQLEIDTAFKVSWYARRISDILPNPWQAARIAQEMVQRLRDGGKDNEYIYSQRNALDDQLRRHVIREIDQQAQKIFHAKLAAGEIRFDLELSDHNHRLTKSYEILVADSDRELQRFGESVQFSLFDKVYERNYNDLEKRFAFYLDEQKALDWWHRVAVRQRGDYYIRGWRRDRIYPDFIAMASATEGSPSILVFETKGDQFKGNDDTLYKGRVFAALEQAFNAGKMVVKDGPAKGIFRLVFDQVGFPDVQKALSKLNGVYSVKA